MKLLELVPAGAVPLRDRGAFEVPLQQCETHLLKLFGAGAGRHPQLERFRLPLATEWPAVAAFYTARLGSAWRRSDVPEQQLGFRLRVWQHAQQRFAAALLDETGAGSEDPRPFKMLVVAVEGG